MRTTLSIDDQLLVSAKLLAQARGLTLGRLVEEALRREIASSESTPTPPRIPVYRGKGGLRPGVDVDSMRSLHEVLDENVPLEKLR